MANARSRLSFLTLLAVTVNDRVACVSPSDTTETFVSVGRPPSLNATVAARTPSVREATSATTARPASNNCLKMDRPEPGGVTEHLGHQPGLAYPGLARDQQGSRLAGCRPLDRRPEPGHLGVAADQHRAGNPPPHTVHHPQKATIRTSNSRQARNGTMDDTAYGSAQIWPADITLRMYQPGVTSRVS